MRLLSLLVSSLLAGLSLAVPASYIRHEKRHVIDERLWVKRERAPLDAQVPVRIALQQRNLHKGNELLMDVSHPKSANYGQHWTTAEVARTFAPSQESIDAVSDWLSSSGIGTNRHVVSPGKHWIKFNASMDELEQLLRTQYHVYENQQTRESHVSCEEYHVPHTVHPHIDFIHPTIGQGSAPLGRRKVKRTTATGSLPPIIQGLAPATNGNPDPGDDNPDCTNGATPECIRALYGIPLPPQQPQKGNELGVFEEGDHYTQRDLNYFWGNYSNNIPSGTGPILKSVDGATGEETDGFGGEESILDFQLVFPLVYPQDVWLYQVDDPNYETNTSGFGNTFLDALDASYCTFEGGDAPGDPKYPDNRPNGYNKTEMCGTYTPTSVISISYGLAESMFPVSYTTRQCQEFMKLALQGISIIYASGDSGVAARTGCIDRNGTQAFNPDYPASCPYVTSVGATQLAASKNVSDPEVAVNDPDDSFWSGGGFSNVFAQPDWQADAVKTFLTDHKPPYGPDIFNASGRAYPDVSALGLDIIIIDGGFKMLEGGTSASTPIFASIINLINDDRIKAGKNATGFLNPVLYQHPEAFRDIVNGSNPGCNTTGFDAVPGWDPVTGLGTPNFTVLHDVFMALP